MAYRILVGGYSTLLTTLLFNPYVSPPTLEILNQSPSGINASWLAPHPTNCSIVFGSQEIDAGGVASFLIQPDGSARIVSNVSTYGSAPAYVGVLSNLRDVVAMNYNSGNGAVIPLELDGVTLTSPPPQGLVAFNGSGPNLARQTSAHPHMVFQNGATNSQELLVPDLGSDKVWRLTSTAPNTYNIAGYIQQPLGSGPRHGVLYTPPLPDDDFESPTTYLYMVHELANTVTQQTIPSLSSGIQPELVAMVPTIPEGGDNTTIATAEILLSPINALYDEQYLYVSNRWDPDPAGDTVAIMTPDPLTVIAQVRTGLYGIRGMMLGGDQDQYVIVGGQGSGGVAVYERVNGGANLTLMARLNSSLVEAPTTFVWLD
ncbi:isomerase YbhE [Dacryopinax primogenitus]|uniref:Isomerase YbhE n=1 Tax=Dacryopinax primogenitus (strain DJM 731) TaxID=1858805 RepID=M5GBD7_DACPD|nr:isomerase YbhE [Dacryopinax primogenitus]EJU05685.1 isomerase YbhE [Dacryopinax primogenitus]